MLFPFCFLTNLQLCSSPIHSSSYESLALGTDMNGENRDINRMKEAITRNMKGVQREGILFTFVYLSRVVIERLIKMIFINTRPVDENAVALNNRRKSSSLPKESNSACDTAKLAILLVLMYLLLSVVCIVLHYPLSLMSLLVPSLLLFFLLSALRKSSQFNVWTSSFLATLGLLIKGGAIVTFFSIFDISSKEKRIPLKGNEMEGKTIFFIIVFMAELLAIVAAGCMKWHLVAFRTDSQLRQVVQQKRKESRMSP